MKPWMILLLCVVVAVPVHGSTPVAEHTSVEVTTTHEPVPETTAPLTHEVDTTTTVGTTKTVAEDTHSAPEATHAADPHAALEVETRYAPTQEDMAFEVLSFGEKSHGVIEAGWNLVEFEEIDAHGLGELALLRGTGIRDIAEETFVYGETAVYQSHAKGLEVIILEFKDIESAKEVYAGILKKLLGQKFISSNEFGYEGYAASVFSPVQEVNGFRRGQFIVQVAKKDEAIHYDVKMMGKVIDNDLKEYAQYEGVIYEFDPFMRLDSNGLVIGQLTISTGFIGISAILIGLGTTLIFVAIGALFFFKRVKIKRPKVMPKIAPRAPKLKIREYINQEVGGIPRPPKRILMVMASITLFILVLAVLVLNATVHYVLIQSTAPHEPGSIPEKVYRTADRFIEMGADGITVRMVGLHLSQFVIVGAFITLILGGIMGVVLVAAVILVLKKKGLKPPGPRIPKTALPKIKGPRPPRPRLPRISFPRRKKP